MDEAHRQKGCIESVNSGMNEDYGIRTCWVFVDFGGSVQGFGGLSLEDKLPLYINELCWTFDVERIEQLLGRACYALRSFPEWNEPIEGLEALSGRRFTRSGFGRRHFKPFDVFEKRKETLTAQIERATVEIQRARIELATLGERFIDWEQP